MTDAAQSENPVTIRRKIDDNTKEWSSDLDTELPISGGDIPNFKSWINFNGFNLDREIRKGHDGFDFAAYLTMDGKVVLGLPPETPIRAIADGTVAQVLDNPEVVKSGYGVMINIEHGDRGSGMYSGYIHVVPQVEHGQQVKKGDVIATLYKDPGETEGRLVHLHLGLTSGWDTRGGGFHQRLQDPRFIDNEIYAMPAEPQGDKNFKVPSLPNAAVEVANFLSVRVNSR